MRHPLRRAVVLALTLTAPAFSQVFTTLPGPPLDDAPAFAVPGPRPTSGHLVVVDHEAFSTVLLTAPMHRPEMVLRTEGLPIDLPNPTGGFTRCRVAESPVMEPGLGGRFPQIRTYLVQAEDRSAVGRLEVSPRGLTAMLRTATGASWMIDPWRSADASLVVAYNLHDLPGGTDWVCSTPNPEPEDRPRHHAATGVFEPRSLQATRVNRLAMSCTGEYGLYHSTIQGHAPNVADPLAAIVTVVSRTNVVYEQDLAVHFNLVATNDRVIFTNPETDPYPSSCDGGGGADCSYGILNALGNVLGGAIGGANYNAGHCITRIAGGVAFLPGACGGVGVSGIPRGGDVDPFSALVVIHELGHQFAANHTFSGTRGRCGNNANLSTAWEAGSGSSPMAYAGGCPVGDAAPSDNIVQFAEPFFHHGSIEETRNFLADNRSSCMTPVASSNNTPEITFLTTSANIPPSTPFTLTVAATDVDNDLLTYSWEQFDSGARRPLSGEGALDTGVGALFRIFSPTTDSSRTFPRMADVLAGVATPGEQLPSVTAVQRRFRAIVRDNHPGAGASVVSPFVTLTIPSLSSAFSVQSPAEGSVLRPGDAAVTWSVGRTDRAPFNVSTVSIRLSLDGGQTFPTLLGTYPNTGAATVTLPEVTAANARLRVAPTEGIFFAISRPFSVQVCPGDFNRDGFLDFFDYGAFVSAFESGGDNADFNRDGFVDFFDYGSFVEAFESGC